MRRLAIELYGTLVGTLEGADSASADFRADAQALDRFGVNSHVLSASIPLSPRPSRAKAKRRRNFFHELLPEGDQLTAMNIAAGLRPGDILGFLARYGRDVAGALQIWDLDDPTEPPTPELIPVTNAEIRELLTEPYTFPLANRPVTGKTSLAGVQPKIVLARTDGHWAQAVGGAPSTHILKPIVERQPSLIYDEEYGARLARALGLASYDSHIDDFAGVPALVIERYDRDPVMPGGRIHQEDFNQALGATGAAKYQELGGVVSLARVAEVLKVVGAASDRTPLARMVVFAVAIGNLDMHAKNIGLIHYADSTARLAPAYDAVPHTHLAGNDGRMALAVCGEYRHAALTRDHLVAEIAGWGLRNASELVDGTLQELQGALATESPSASAHALIQEHILRFTQNLLAGRPAGRGATA